MAEKAVHPPNVPEHASTVLHLIVALRTSPYLFPTEIRVRNGEGAHVVLQHCRENIIRSDEEKGLYKSFIFHKNYFKNFFRMKIVPVQFVNKLLL